MNIGIFSECYKPTINGVVMSIEAFRNQLEKKGHRVYIFAPRHKKAVFAPNVFRVPSITLPTPKDYPIALPFFEFSFLSQIVASLDLDIIHTQHIFSMGGAGQKLAKKFHLPTIHTYHTMMTEYTHYLPVKILQGITKRFIIWRSRRFCNRADLVIVPSSPIKTVLEKYGIKKEIEVLPTGIELKNFKKLSENERRTICKKYKIPNEKKVLLFVGRLAQEKNLDFLLDSFAEILQKDPETFLVFVGNGPYEQNLKSQIKNLKLQSYVALTGFLPKEETNKLFGAADLFVFPSTTDTQGIVLAESLASGTPVVTINKLGPKDIIKNDKDGFLVPLQKKQFIDKILYLLKNDKIRHQFGYQAQQNVKKFAIESCTERLIEIYQETIKNYQRKQ